MQLRLPVAWCDWAKGCRVGGGGLGPATSEGVHAFPFRAKSEFSVCQISALCCFGSQCEFKFEAEYPPMLKVGKAIAFKPSRQRRLFMDRFL